MKPRQILLILVIIVSIISCKTTQKMKNELPNPNKTEQLTPDGNLIVSGQIIKKKFVMKRKMQLKEGNN